MAARRGKMSNPVGEQAQMSLVPANSPVPVPTPEDRKPWERPSDSKQKQKVAQILILKAGGKKGPEIAELMGTSEGYIRHLLWLAGKNGWFTEDDLVDPADKLAYETVHKVVRNINLALDGQELKQGQQEMTIETAKGLGVFKNHSATKVEGTMTLPSLSIKIELPDVKGERPLPADIAGGAPAYVEGEVVRAPE